MNVTVGGWARVVNLHMRAVNADGWGGILGYTVKTVCERHGGDRQVCG